MVFRYYGRGGLNNRRRYAVHSSVNLLIDAIDAYVGYLQVLASGTHSTPVAQHHLVLATVLYNIFNRIYNNSDHSRENDSSHRFDNSVS